MLQLEDAINQILSKVPTATPERIALSAADGRVLLQPITASIDLPRFDNSAMDGYAVRAEDLLGARRDNPVRLKIGGITAAGQGATVPIQPGCAVRVFTGSMLPAGADCVVMQEDTIVNPTDVGTVSVVEQATPWENVRLRGEDVRAGSQVLAAGETLGAGELSLLAALGFTEVSVGRRPVVGIVATGSELKEPGQPLEIGQIYESNRVGLSALVRAAGGTPLLFPIVSDSMEATTQALRRAVSECDLLVTVGGASVGDYDFIKPALQEVGGKIDFWRVSMKPGRPLLLGEAENKLIFGLPGNPVSALTTFLLLVRPSLRKWQGATHTALRAVPGKLAEPLGNPGSRRHFVRVKMDGAGEVRMAGPQASHMLGSFAAADGLVDVGAETTLLKGEPVLVQIWEL